ncbi:MAG: hypothetical protein BGO67_07290 [Alphaproteobacteria bacterium 41-28]|nr:MAG: hypothetical protein BGO67_07290 [Alphaproteobacteria bacterium 41-28]
MKQEEQNIQRYLQIREDIHEEIKKISPSVAAFQDTVQRFAAQLEELQKLSQTTQDHIKSAIKSAALEMADIASGEFSEKTEDKINIIITNLDHSVKNARKALDVSAKTKMRKMLLFTFTGILLSGFMGFGGGFLYCKRNAYYLPADFIKMYALGYDIKEALSKMSFEEKRQFEKLMGR